MARGDIDAAIDAIRRDAEAFGKTYRGRVDQLSGAELAEAISVYETIVERADIIDAYAELSVCADATQDVASARLREKLNAALKDSAFFSYDIGRMPETDIITKYAAPELARYAGWLGQVRDAGRHILPDDVETYRQEKAAVGENMWQRLYDRLRQDMRYVFDGRAHTPDETQDILRHGDDAQRRRAYHAFNRENGVLRKKAAFIISTLAQLKYNEDCQRDYEHPEDERHVANNMQKKTVDTMVTEIRAAYPQLAHRYYAWLAAKTGEDKVPDGTRVTALSPQFPVSFDTARDKVVAVFSAFAPEHGRIAQSFFDDRRIDAAPRAGKQSGAFMHPVAASAAPYIFLNYKGKAEDVLTLAHETGHGVHQTLAARAGHLQSDTPLPVAETASLFAERLLSDALLARDNITDAERHAILARQADRMLNTVVRMTTVFTFEQRLHAEHRDTGELSGERLTALWVGALRESLGPAVDFSAPSSRNHWVHMPQLVHTPFYSYAYAFGECMAAVLHDMYKNSDDKKAFADKYTRFLEDGGRRSPAALYDAFGIDIDDPAVWRRGTALIARQLQDFMDLDDKLAPRRRLTPAFNARTGRAPANDKTSRRKKQGPGRAA